MRTKRLVFDALLAAVALVIFVVELQIPPLTPVPGIKPGLANIITLTVMFVYGPVDALAVLLVRILLGGLLYGSPSALIYSLAGGLCSYLVLFLLRRILTGKQVFVSGVFCAIAHNAGQVAVAVLITRTPAIFYYLPVLVVSAVITGLFTGFAAQALIPAVKRIKDR